MLALQIDDGGSFPDIDASNVGFSGILHPGENWNGKKDTGPSVLCQSIHDAETDENWFSEKINVCNCNSHKNSWHYV